MTLCGWVRKQATHHIYVSEYTGFQYAYISKGKRKLVGKWVKTWYVHVRTPNNTMGFTYMGDHDSLNDAKRLTQILCASMYQTETRSKP